MVCLAVLLLKSAEIYMKAFCHSVKASLLKSLPPEGTVGQKRINAYLIFEKIFLYRSRLLR
jgi:hypothetical protein